MERESPAAPQGSAKEGSHGDGQRGWGRVRLKKPTGRPVACGAVGIDLPEGGGSASALPVTSPAIN